MSSYSLFYFEDTSLALYCHIWMTKVDPRKEYIVLDLHTTSAKQELTAGPVKLHSGKSCNYL